MKNGILQRNNEEAQNYSNAKNIEIRGMNIEDYINLKIKNVLQYLPYTYSYCMGGRYNDQTIEETSVYENVTNLVETRGNFNNAFIVNNDGTITIGNIPNSKNICQIVMLARFDGIVSVGNKYARIGIIRNEQYLTTEPIGKVTCNNENTSVQVVALTSFEPKPGDIIKFQVYGNSGDNAHRVYFNIALTPYLNNNVLDYLD